MRRKLVTLAFALAAVAAAQGLVSPPSSNAGSCNFRICCSPTGPCYCCVRPCSPQCP
jgi:hypothetical protein